MELVEAETLFERFTRGAVPHEETLLALPADGRRLVGRARRRDRPSGFVEITPAGEVQILYFGLAKLFEKTPPESGLSDFELSCAG